MAKQRAAGCNRCRPVAARLALARSAGMLSLLLAIFSAVGCKTTLPEAAANVGAMAGYQRSRSNERSSSLRGIRGGGVRRHPQRYLARIAAEDEEDEPGEDEDSAEPTAKPTTEATDEDDVNLLNDPEDDPEDPVDAEGPEDAEDPNEGLGPDDEEMAEKEVTLSKNSTEAPTATGDDGDFDNEGTTAPPTPAEDGDEGATPSPTPAEDGDIEGGGDDEFTPSPSAISTVSPQPTREKEKDENENSSKDPTASPTNEWEKVDIDTETEISPSYGYGEDTPAPVPITTDEPVFDWNFTPEPTKAYSPLDDDPILDDEEEGVVSGGESGSGVDGSKGKGDENLLDEAEEDAMGWLNGTPDQESLEELVERDRRVQIAVGIVASLGVVLALITAQQTMNNPDGLCAGCCRLVIRCISCTCRILCLPCHYCCGGTSRADSRRGATVITANSDLEFS